MQKVLTYKSGQFVFSKNYDDPEIMKLILESVILNKTINDLPLLPDLASHLEEEIIIRSIFGTAAIEGNPLSEQAVGDILANGQNVSENIHVQEIANLKKAYQLLESYRHPKSEPALAEETIREFHRAITADLNYDDNQPGKYRNLTVLVGDKNHGGVYTPPKIIEDIRMLMASFIEWINSDEIMQSPPLIRPILAHYYLALIHPFGDGNGRTARIIESLLFKQIGFRYVPEMLSNYFYRNVDDYYWAFSRSLKSKDHNIAPFMRFVLQGVIESLGEIKDKITLYIRIFSLKEFYRILLSEKKITKRQYEFLILLIKSRESISLKNLLGTEPYALLYRNVTDRTARRDLEKLKNLNLISLIHEGRFEINLRALELVRSNQKYFE